MINHFYTINSQGTGLYKGKGSKFYAFSFPINSVAQANNRLDELRKEYHDARHHCYAYILGNNGLQMRANDDGEPKHSAGDPILGQIKSADLTNTLVVVVRYFGGTKLGVSGLIHAYKTAAEEALNSSKKIKQYISIPIHLSYGYGSTNEVMKLIDRYHLKIMHQEFLDRCMLQASIIISKNEAILKDIQLLKDTGYDIKLLT